jgi:maltose alpha-D-glucosyltransferase / alpha-amylase
VTEHEPAAGRPVAPQDSISPLVSTTGSFAAVPNEPVPDFALDRPRDPEWYRRAVFYEVLIRGFQDASGDGTGDIRGLTSRLDYLKWLGIDCIWLLPIYESPLRDGGYDIADYMRVLGEYGDIADFVELSRNHTSAGSGSSPTWS